jgi:hypothetical protein
MTQNSTMESITNKLNRFRTQVYQLAPDKANADIIRLMRMSTEEFLATAQLVITTRGLTSPAQLQEAILSAAGLEDAFGGLPRGDQVVLEHYCKYFYEVCQVLMQPE